VWGEMRVLQGLDHPNIVRPMSTSRHLTPHPSLTPCSFRCRSNFTTGSSRGQNTTSVLSSPWAESSLNASASEDTSRNEMPWRYFGMCGRFPFISIDRPRSHPAYETDNELFSLSSVLSGVKYLHDHDIAHRDLKYVSPPFSCNLGVTCEIQ
jgi:serine/threonine protein kinase